jgi:hypothetical protein
VYIKGVQQFPLTTPVYTRGVLIKLSNTHWITFLELSWDTKFLSARLCINFYGSTEGVITNFSGRNGGVPILSSSSYRQTSCKNLQYTLVTFLRSPLVYTERILTKSVGMILFNHSITFISRLAIKGDLPDAMINHFSSNAQGKKRSVKTTSW